MSKIDARRLTVPQLYQAKNIDWCLQLNDTLRRKGKRTDELMYPPEKFDNISKVLSSQVSWNALITIRL